MSLNLHTYHLSKISGYNYIYFCMYIYYTDINIFIFYIYHIPYIIYYIIISLYILNIHRLDLLIWYHDFLYFSEYIICFVILRWVMCEDLWHFLLDIYTAPCALSQPPSLPGQMTRKLQMRRALWPTAPRFSDWRLSPPNKLRLVFVSLLVKCQHGQEFQTTSLGFAFDSFHICSALPQWSKHHQNVLPSRLLSDKWLNMSSKEAGKKIMKCKIMGFTVDKLIQS